MMELASTRCTRNCEEKNGKTQGVGNMTMEKLPFEDVLVSPIKNGRYIIIWVVATQIFFYFHPENWGKMKPF